MCTVLLPPGVNPTAVNIYIIYVFNILFVFSWNKNKWWTLNLVVSTVSLFSHWSGSTTGMSNLKIPLQNSSRTIHVTSWKARSLKSTAVKNSNFTPDSWTRGRDLNPGCPVYEPEELLSIVVGHAAPLATLQVHSATCVRVAVLEATVVFIPGKKLWNSLGRCPL